MNDFLRTSTPDWAGLSKEWERSGLSQKAFCKKKRVSYPAFCYHRSAQKKRKRQAARLFPAPTKSGHLKPVASFIEVEKPVAVEAGAVADSVTPEIEVELPFGVKLRFRGVVKQ